MEHLEKRVTNEEPQAFDSVDAGASFTTPEPAGRLNKGMHLMIRGQPCKITEVSRKAPGKHGHAKCHFVAKDIFSGSKMEQIIPAGHNADVPVVTKTEYMLMYPELVKPGDHVSLLDLNTCHIRADLKLPLTDGLAARIKAMAAEEQDVAVVVLAACGQEMITDAKVMTAPPA